MTTVVIPVGVPGSTLFDTTICGFASTTVDATSANTNEDAKSLLATTVAGSLTMAANEVAYAETSTAYLDSLSDEQLATLSQMVEEKEYSLTENEILEKPKTLVYQDNTKQLVSNSFGI